MASFTYTQYSYAVSVTISGLTSGNKCRVFVRLASDTTNTTVDQTITATSTSLTKVFSGLLPATNYVMNVQIDGGSWLGSVSFTTGSAVSAWSWSKSNGSATAAQTSKFYSVLIGGAQTSGNLSYLVWNDLVDKVHSVLYAYGLSWDSTYASKDNTKVKAGSTLSAAIYNSLRNNMNRIKATNLPVGTKNSQVYGKYITGLADAINNAI